MIKKVIDIDIDAKGAVKGLDEINEGVQDIDSSTDDLQENTKGLTSSIDKMTGGLVTGFKSAVVGVKKGILAMKSLKIAIAATGVGLLLIAFAALIAFFTKSQKGMDALSRAFAGFSAAVDVIIDRVIAIGELLANIFNKPLKETLAGIGDEFKGIGDEIERDVRLAIELEAATQRLRDLERGQSLAIAIQRKEIEKLRIESKDLTKTNEERVESLEKALSLEDFILQQELKNQRERVRIAKAEFERANSTAADEQEFIDEKIRLVDLETSSLRRQRTVITELESLKAQGRKSEEEGEKEKEEKRKRVKPLEAQLAQDQEITNTATEIAQAKAAEAGFIINQIKEEIRQEDLDNEQAYVDARLKMQLELARGIAGALSAIGALFEKGTAASKAAALAEVIIGTGVGFIRGLKIAQQSAEGTGPLAAFSFPIFYATQIAAVLGAAAQAKNILSAVEGSTGGISTGTPTPQAPQVQAPQFNIVGDTGINQLAASIGQQTQQTIKAFVVAKDVTTQQELDRNTVSTATFGN